MAKVKIDKYPSQDDLNSLGVEYWPIWEKEVSSFPWFYDSEEVCYLLEGRVTVKTSEGDFYIQKGDLVTFAQGLNCEWIIEEAVKKHYQFNE